ncbi:MULTISPECIES: ScbR family autoregulator-binding transcription factor [unclassified Streptomyces]|uniref:ScbR family autoregulator-binding transcription factor n=1 Tax=unclassified Streptomyces TaxID=2593676 RepID=UPI0022533EF7|nr:MULTISPECIES: ScbR family autoregulator-binding transcription factor [unclassified Streptomyces]MCX4884368.1 ScbR family autoregulator-binding transcription factor [Streptomyces sp. NBC_00847]MCX5051822.1 ScbR family autoregulator-binding transcription factor [Streptomyces sp. NBC_00474]MCX5062152.1 ScbR family autoregulator-binding transcription factor [Streptomyces sp. NBC_00452]MCX5249716.1 ScbR family autoregulator-binding transcription factor [Streptomyces sp. NBC_00201]MCX5292239.1 Sc
MARQLRAEQTRATIITAAADLFDRHGYESTSLSDIVEHAQVTKGALYFHFAAKEDLAHAIMELQSRAWHEVTKELDGRGYSSLESLIRITFGIARLSVEGPIPRAGLRLATGGVAVRPPLKHPFTEWRDMATRRLLGAIKEADVHPDVDVEAVAHSLVSFFVGTRVVGRSLEPVARQPRRLAEMWHVMIRGLVPVPRRARYLSLAARLEREIRTV